MTTDFRTRALHGGVAKLAAKAMDFLLRMGTLVIIARLLDPGDFGLVGMVTALTGVLGLFREFGLSVATVQRESVSAEQISTLFWINLLVGVLLAVVCVICAPMVADFYKQPSLLAVMAVVGLGFVFNGAGVQHSAVLQRRMRFEVLALIDVAALAITSVTSVAMALAGYGYWSLVAWAVVLPFATTVLLWRATKWTPGRPVRGTGVGSMLRFGGTVTLNGVVVYVAYNLDKVLLGRVWGAEALGFYGRAYQLVNIPVDFINLAAGSVAIPLLSRMQGEPQRLRKYFLSAYSFVLALTVPVAAACGIFAKEIVLVLFGEKWIESAILLQLLAPTIVAFALINPTGWLLTALGMVRRSLHIAFVLAPIVVTGCVIGIPYGSRGVATGFSLAMTLWVVPHLLWCVHGTVVTFRDLVTAAAPPCVAGAIASLAALQVYEYVQPLDSPLLRLIMGSAVLGTVHATVLVFGLGQKAFYREIIRGIRNRDA